MDADATGLPPSPWHPGELALQRSAGAAEHLAELGPRVVRDYMPDQQRDFYAALPYAIFGTALPNGEVWATARAGVPGFIQSPDPYTLQVASPVAPADPAEAGLVDGAAIGVLGIDLATRRRNRANGTVQGRDAAGFRIDVGQSFGNCPRYIQRREYRAGQVSDAASADQAVVTEGLDARARAFIAAADTFFVASCARLETGDQVDVSHRGGKTGFVRVGEDGLLTIPDFAGNKFFNTLGNFLVNPQAGLLFIDFATGGLLQLTGEARVLLDSPEMAAFDGAERLWTFRAQKAVYRPRGLPLHWDFQEEGWSPHALQTGNWRDVPVT